jgi:hypothetical protein
MQVKKNRDLWKTAGGVAELAVADGAEVVVGHVRVVQTDRRSRVLVEWVSGPYIGERVWMGQPSSSS